MSRIGSFLLTTAAVVFALAGPAQAAFHLMQIEQVIGGVNGDTTAQAIQLRMRTVGQNFVASTRLVVVDAMGGNPIILENITTNVASGQAGRRILLTTPNFANYLDVPLVSNFIMDPIPESYLAAGQLRFQNDFGTIYWSLSWGGLGYTGTTSGSFDNDPNGNFGPPVEISLPSNSLRALRYTGSASSSSTSNLSQYTITDVPATFINNANQSFTLIPEPAVGALAVVAWSLAPRRQRSRRR